MKVLKSYCNNVSSTSGLRVDGSRWHIMISLRTTHTFHSMNYFVFDNRQAFFYCLITFVFVASHLVLNIH